MHSPETLRQIFEMTRRSRRAVHRRRGDDRRRPDGNAVGPSAGRHRSGPDLCRQDAHRRHLPLAATLASPRIVAAFDSEDRAKTFFHGHSFTAHPLACAVAAANWKLLLESDGSPALDMEAFWHRRWRR